jgi:glycosyltransferase involved in cell wall biosynthesis
LKILEAFARGVPVVASTKAAEGLVVKHDVQLLLADSDEQISSAVLKIIRQPELASRLVFSGREYVNQYHTLEVMEEQMGRLIKNKLLP